MRGDYTANEVVGGNEKLSRSFLHGVAGVTIRSAVIYFPRNGSLAATMAEYVLVAFMYRFVKWGITVSRSNCISAQPISIVTIEIAILDTVFFLAHGAAILFLFGITDKTRARARN